MFISYSKGHGTAIGKRTGKCLGVTLRTKKCRCKRQKNCPKKHKCRKNWDGSSKGMEPHMGVELIKQVEEQGVRVRGIIGDEDSSTISRARKEVRAELEKDSDMNHVKKTVSNALYALRPKHKALSQKVIKYLLKNFTFAITQNQGQPTEIKKNLAAIVPHSYGEHDHCNENWCGFKKNGASYKHKSLPWGRDLRDSVLRKELERIFKKHEGNANGLACIGSTQANESLNNTIASKAPKNRHFSESGSLEVRVHAAAAQKNAGYEYVADVSCSMNRYRIAC